MGFRFQRRIRIFKGFNINLSKSGIGFSVGPRGAKLGISSKGQVYGSAGIPGTGLSYRATFSKGSTQSGAAGQPTTPSPQQAVPGGQYLRPPSTDRTTVAAYAIGAVLMVVIVGLIAVFATLMRPSPVREAPTTTVTQPAPAQQPEPLKVYTYGGSNVQPPAQPATADESEPSSYSPPTAGAKTKHVSGYRRKDGTYVHSYHRRSRRY